MYYMFQDRIEAGFILASRLKKYKHEKGIILAVPRGGVPVGFIVARELGFPLDIVLTKKIGHPMNKEYAIGAASLFDYFVVSHDDVSNEYIREEVQRVRNRLKEMQQKFIGDKKHEILKGKTVIVVDDGIATGNTLSGTVKLLRKSEVDRIIIAVPVASASAVEKLSKEADELIVIEIPETFYGVGAFYENFEQVSDEQVVYYLEKLRNHQMNT